MIAKDSGEPEITPEVPQIQTARLSKDITGRIAEPDPLSRPELYQLTLYKWKYSLETYGFEKSEVQNFMFLKWLHATRRVVP